jgi:hypothetical protein
MTFSYSGFSFSIRLESPFKRAILVKSTVLEVMRLQIVEIPSLPSTLTKTPVGRTKASQPRP